MIVRLEAQEFPDAFAPDGRERLETLRNAAEELERQGALRVVRDKGPLAGVPKELRLGPEHVESAYVLAGTLGFERLADAFERLSSLCQELKGAEPAGPDWMLGFLESTRAAAAAFDSSPLGVSRGGFKKSANEWVGAIRGAWGISRGWHAWERVVSERIFRDSKRIGVLRSLIIDLLVRADPQWDGVAPDEADQVLEAYGVRRKPGLLRCAGRGTLRIGSRHYELSDFVPSAHLPDAWASAWVDAVAPGLKTVTLVENEFPFLSYIEESGGAVGLGERGEVAVYVAGFPTPGLVDALARLSKQAPASQWRHWGDADVGGIRIWWFLRNRLGRPLEWFRSTTAWVEAVAQVSGGTALSAKEGGALEQLAKRLRESSLCNEPDVQSVISCANNLRTLGRKVEQERF